MLDERVNACRRVFERYYDALSAIDGITFMPDIPHGRSTRWLTTLTLDPATCPATPAQIIDALEEENIEARPVWKPLHLQPLFEGTPLLFPYPERERLRPPVRAGTLFAVRHESDGGGTGSGDSDCQERIPGVSPLAVTKDAKGLIVLRIDPFALQGQLL